jgi:hypothetical protein
MTLPFYKGPDPDQFRVDVYGSRWYEDNLPADRTRVPMSDPVPSVTTIKSGWSKPFKKKLPSGKVVPLDAYRVAEEVAADPTIVDQFPDPEELVEHLSQAPDRFLEQASGRGTEIHFVMETLGAGLELDEALLSDTTKAFLPVCRQFMADRTPIFRATEVVVFNRSKGFAGTADAIIEDPDLGLVIVDWKSRGGQHGCYEEEIAQLGGYSEAEYLVVIDPETGEIRRLEPFNLDGLAVVSIMEDSYQVFPISLEEARKAFAGMHRSWKGARNGRSDARRAKSAPIVGWAPDTTDMVPALEASLAAANGTPAPGTAQVHPDRLAWITARVGRIREAGRVKFLARAWPDGVPTLKSGKPLTEAQVDLIAQACQDVEDLYGERTIGGETTDVGPALPFGERDPGAATVEEVPMTSEEAVTADAQARLKEDAKAEAQDWATKGAHLCDGLTGEQTRAVAELAGIGPGDTMTERHFHRLEAVVSQVGESIFLTSNRAGAVRIIVGPDAESALLDGRPKAEALAHAKAVAQSFGMPTPRSVGQAADNPRLVALVAAGWTPNNHQ